MHLLYMPVHKIIFPYDNMLYIFVDSYVLHNYPLPELYICKVFNINHSLQISDHLSSFFLILIQLIKNFPEGVHQKQKQQFYLSIL